MEATMTNLDDQGWQPKWVFLDGVGWWPYGDLELDDYERELEESIARGEWRSVPNLEEEMERARQMARNTMATWSEAQLSEVRQRVEAKNNGTWKSPPPLADDTVSSDNPQLSENI
jgi:hypothetical protein